MEQEKKTLALQATIEVEYDCPSTASPEKIRDNLFLSLEHAIEEGLLYIGARGTIQRTNLSVEGLNTCD